MVSLLYHALGWYYTLLSSSASLYLLFVSEEQRMPFCWMLVEFLVQCRYTWKVLTRQSLLKESPLILEITTGKLKCRNVLWVSVRSHWSFSRESEEADLLSLKTVAEALTPMAVMIMVYIYIYQTSMCHFTHFSSCNFLVSASELNSRLMLNLNSVWEYIFWICYCIWQWIKPLLQLSLIINFHEFFPIRCYRSMKNLFHSSFCFLSVLYLFSAFGISINSFSW